jgi:hypothetical protein
MQNQLAANSRVGHMTIGHRGGPVALLACSLLWSHAFAQSTGPDPAGTPYDIDWFTIDSGGDSSSAGPLVLEGTIGQHDAGAEIQGAGYSLIGGYWPLGGADLCLADINQDGALDFFDYLDFVAAFSEGLPPADFNYDGNIDFFDYLDFVASFSNGC